MELEFHAPLPPLAAHKLAMELENVESKNFDGLLAKRQMR